MKKMTCNDLGGACDLEFKAETFEEMKQLSQQHGMEMFKKGDQPHLDAMNKMKSAMQAEGAFDLWLAEKKDKFNALPEI